MGGAVARMVQKREAFGDLMGKFERKRSLGRRRRICKDNIERDLKEIG
jgi:hypothetical protein